MIKSYYLILLFYLIPCFMIGQNLLEHQWKNRILIINFEDAGQENYIEQLRLLKTHQKGLSERKLVVYQVCGKLYKLGWDEKSVWQPVNDAILPKTNLDKKTNFSVILIGLDGGIKASKSAVFPMTELFGIIDAMPMRVQEMKYLEADNK